MNEKDPKKKIPKMPAPPAPVGFKAKGSKGFGAPPVPSGPSASVPAPPMPSLKDSKKKKKENNQISEEMEGLESRLSKEREDLFGKLKDREEENLRLQEQFLEKERQETIKRQEEIARVKDKLEDEQEKRNKEFKEREKELDEERRKWKETLDNLRKESEKKVSLEKTQALIRQQAFEEAQKQVYDQLEEMKADLENAKKEAYEQKIKHREEEKNTVKVEHALRDVIQSVSRNKRLEEAEREKDRLRSELYELEDGVVQEKLKYSQKLKDSEELRNNLRLDYQTRIKENQLQFESSLSELQTANTDLNSRIIQIQNKLQNKQEIWDERIRDKINEGEKVVADFQKKLSEVKFEYSERLSKAEFGRDSAIKDYQNLSKQFEEKQIELSSKVVELEKEKDLIEKEKVIELGLIKERLKDSEREFEEHKRRLKESMSDLQLRLNSNDSIWQQKINELRTRQDSEIERAKSNYELKLIDYQNELEKMKAENEVINDNYLQLKGKLEIESRLKDSLKDRSENEFEKEIERLNKSKDDIEDEYKEKIAHLKQEFSEGKNKMNSLLKEKEDIIERSNRKVLEVIDDSNVLKLDLQEKNAIIQRKDSEMKSFEGIIEEYTSRNKDLQSKLAEFKKDKEDAVFELRKEIQKIERDKYLKVQEVEEKYSNQFGVLENQISVSRSTIREMREQKDAQIRTIAEEYERYKANQEWMRKEWQNQKEELVDEYKDKELNYKSKISELNLTLQEIDQLKKIDETRFAEQINAIKVQYERDLQSYKNKIEELNNELIAEKESRTERLALAEKEITRLKKELVNAQNKFMDHEQASSQKIISLEDISNRNGEILQRLKDEARMWESKYNEKSDENKILHLEIKNKEGEYLGQVERLKNKYEELLSMYENKVRAEKDRTATPAVLPQNYDADARLLGEVHDLREDNEHLNKQLIKKEEDLIELREEFLGYKRDTTEYIKDLERAEGLSETQTKEIEELKRVQEMSEGEIQGIIDQTTELKNEIARLEAERIQEKKDYDTILLERESVINELEKRLNDELSIKNNNEEELGGIRAELKEYEADNVKIREQLDEKENIIEELKLNIDDLRKEHKASAELIKEIDIKDEMIKSKESEITNLQSELSARESTLKKLEDKLREVESSIPDPVDEELLAAKDGEINELTGAIEKLRESMVEIEQKASENNSQQIAAKEKIIEELKSGLEEAISEIEIKNEELKEYKGMAISESSEASAADPAETSEYKEKYDELLSENRELKEHLQELKAQLDVGLEELKKAGAVNPKVDEAKIDKKWMDKWEKREKEIQEFVAKTKKAVDEKNRLKQKLDVALKDQKTLSEMAQKEAQGKEYYHLKHDQLLKAYEESQKSFLNRVLNRLKGSNNILFL